MKGKFLHALALFAALLAAGEAGAKTVTLKPYNVKMTLPAVAQIQRDSSSVGIFFPASDGFSPNIQIFNEGYSSSMHSYVSTILPQLRAAGYVVLQSSFKGKTDWLAQLLLTNNMGTARVFIRTVDTKRGVILMTATTLASQWPARSPQLVKIVKAAVVAK